MTILFDTTIKLSLDTNHCYGSYKCYVQDVTCKLGILPYIKSIHFWEQKDIREIITADN